MKRSSGVPRAGLAVVAVVATCAFLGSCGNDDTDSSSTASTAQATPSASSSPTEGSAAPSGDVCEDRDALRASIDALKEVDLVAEGTNGLTEAVNAVKEDLSALGSSVTAEVQPQVQAVQDAVDELETAVANRDSGGNAPVVAAVRNVSSSAGTLLTSLGSGACGESATPTT